MLIKMRKTSHGAVREAGSSMEKFCYFYCLRLGRGQFARRGLALVIDTGSEGETVQGPLDLIWKSDLSLESLDLS